jgi:hypothetical protein
MQPNIPERLRHDTMHVKDFRYIRMSGIAGAGEWDALPKNEVVWNIQFPDNAVKFRCRSSKGAEVLIQ